MNTDNKMLFSNIIDDIDYKNNNIDNIDYKNNNIDNIEIKENIQKIYNNLINILEQGNCIDSLEEFCDNRITLYIANLFMQYCEYIGSDPKYAIEYIITNNIQDYKLLIATNPEFIKFIELLNKARTFYMNHLYTFGVDFKSKKTIELNKGEYDTCITTFNSSISKYNTTNNLWDSIVYQQEQKSYEVSDKGYVKEIEDGSTFILHNPSSIFEVFRTLQMLAGTNNELILSVWGFTSENKKRIDALKNYREILVLLSQLGINLHPIDTKSDDLESLFCETIKIHTKQIKKVVEPSQLLTKTDKQILNTALEYCKIKGYDTIYQERSYR